jgi:hypothetical protein
VGLNNFALENLEIKAHENFHIGFLSIEIFSLEIVVFGTFILIAFVLADALKYGCCVWHRESFNKIGAKVVIAWSLMMAMDNMRQFCN